MFLTDLVTVHVRDSLEFVYRWILYLHPSYGVVKVSGTSVRFLVKKERTSRSSLKLRIKRESRGTVLGFFYMEFHFEMFDRNVQ